MTRWLGRYSETAYFLLRVVLAFLYLCHGLRWLSGIYGGTVALTSRFGVAGIIETIAGTLMILGLFTSCAAFVASGEMAVAYFIAHVRRTGEILPILNNGEITVALCFGFLYIATRGGGAFSVDALRRKGKGQ
jgi:putative oxidoreductase